MNIDISLILQILATTFSFIVMIYVLRARHANVIIRSRLTKDKGKSIAAIRILKEGQKRLVVEAVRFPLIVWDNSPRIVVNGINKALRIYEDASGYRSGSKYVSDEAVEYSDDGRKMEDNDVLHACVDLDGMMEAFARSRESLIHPILFRLMLLKLNVEVHCTNSKIYKQKAHREIKHYIIKKIYE